MIPLRYGMNPHQTPACYQPVTGRSPLHVVHGEPSYINLLDALNAWQLVRETAAALDVPVAASFKHVSPAGVAIAGPLDATVRHTYQVGDVSEIARAYLRARDADPKSSYGDFVAVSHPVDADLAAVLKRVVSDGVIAPGFATGTVGTLAAKKGGRFLVLEADPAFEPPAAEVRELYGIRLVQPRDTAPIAGLNPDLTLGSIALRYTQSNSVAYVRDGVTLGIGAGQQSRIDCTRWAGVKTDTWWLRRHPEVASVAGATVTDRIAGQIAAADRLDGRDRWLAALDGVSFVSDGAIPFEDNICEAARHGVRFIAEPGGSIRSPAVAVAARERGIEIVQTGLRLFHH